MDARRRRLLPGALVVGALVTGAVMTLIVVGAEGGASPKTDIPHSQITRNGTPTPVRFEAAMLEALYPDVPVAVEYHVTTNGGVFGHQPRILNGTGDIPGLYAIQDSLKAGDTLQACRQTGSLLRGLILNRLLRAGGEDMYRFTKDDRRDLDPDGIFLFPPQTIRHGVNDGFEIRGVRRTAPSFLSCG